MGKTEEINDACLICLIWHTIIFQMTMARGVVMLGREPSQWHKCCICDQYIYNEILIDFSATRYDFI